MKMDSKIKTIMLEYGRKVLLSDEFKRSFHQPHHLNRTVGDHTLGVTAEAVRLCFEWGYEDEDTLKNVVTASLCHDLGILGRKEKYRNNAECLVRHPLDSVDEYIRITGERDERVIDSIKHHMFPLKPGLPKYKEGWILTFADKIAASLEKMGIPPVSEEERELILAETRQEQNTDAHSIS